jgi:hypothetical protein
MPAPASPEFHRTLINRLEDLVIEAETAGKPLELEPYRGRLFELFVTAEAADLVREGAEPDCSADGICQELAERWGLKEAAAESIRQQSKLGGEDLARMRLLWSVLRMWMEWTYAWERWPEFKGAPSRTADLQATSPEQPA